MTPDERDRLAKLEAHYEGLKEDMSEMRIDVKALRSLAENAKGGWRTLMAVGGIGSVVGAAVAKFVPLIGKTP